MSQEVDVYYLTAILVNKLLTSTLVCSFANINSPNNKKNESVSFETDQKSNKQVTSFSHLLKSFTAKQEIQINASTFHTPNDTIKNCCVVVSSFLTITFHICDKILSRILICVAIVLKRNSNSFHIPHTLCLK